MFITIKKTAGIKKQGIAYSRNYKMSGKNIIYSSL